MYVKRHEDCVGTYRLMIPIWAIIATQYTRIQLKPTPCSMGIGRTRSCYQSIATNANHISYIKFYVAVLLLLHFSSDK